MEQTASEILAEYYTRYLPNMIRTAVAVLHNYDDAETASHDAFLTACAKPEAFLNSPNPAGWLFNTLRFKVLATRTRQAKDSCVIPLSEELTQDMLCDDQHAFLKYRGLIPDEQLALLLDSYSGHYTSEDLARKYGRSVGNVRTVLCRARAKFREAYLKEFEE